MASAGATQGLHLTASVMFDRNTPVFVEDPTYFIAIKILREDLGMNIIPGKYTSIKKLCQQISISLFSIKRALGMEV